MFTACQLTTRRLKGSYTYLEIVSHLGGSLQLTSAEYFNLVDQSGRMIRSDKRGAIDADLKPILLRIGANPHAWIENRLALWMQISSRCRAALQSAQFCEPDRQAVARRSCGGSNGFRFVTHAIGLIQYNLIRPSSGDRLASSNFIDHLRRCLIFSMLVAALPLHHRPLMVYLTLWLNSLPQSLIVSATTEAL